MAKAETYRDYRRLPETNQRMELIDGELVCEPSPNWHHQTIAARLAFRLGPHIEAHQLGQLIFAPMDILLGEHVVQPDLLFISSDRMGIVHEVVEGAPDLVIEILSPATAELDQKWKRSLYAVHGVEEYWLIDPDAATVEILEKSPRGLRRAALLKKEDQLTTKLLPDLAIDLSEVFK